MRQMNRYLYEDQFRETIGLEPLGQAISLNEKIVVVENRENMAVVNAVTRSQTKAELNFKGLNPLIVSDIKIVNSDILKTEQKNDSSLIKYWKMISDQTFEKNYHNFEIGYRVKNDILFRTYKCKKENQEVELTQILVPTCLRNQIMQLGHNSVFSGHFGRKATEDKIASNFFWPKFFGELRRWFVPVIYAKGVLG